MNKYLVISLLFVSNFVIGQNVDAIFKQWKQQPGLSSAQVAFTLYDLDAKSYIFEHNVDSWMTPASTIKVLTTATALKVLGKEYTFQTPIFVNGVVEGGVLKGDVVIVGQGDPTFGSNEIADNNDIQVLEAIYQALKAKGINQVDGGIVVDVSRFGTDALGSQWPWEDIGNYYGGGAWALNYRENEYDVFLKPSTTPGESVEISSIYPPVAGLEIINELKTGKAGSGDNAYIFGAPYTYYKHLRGTIGPGTELYDIQGAFPDPPYQFAWLLKNHLIQQGVFVKGQVEISRKKADQAQMTEVLKFTSKPLSWIIEQTNERSVNLFAETLLRTVGQKRYGIGTVENGVKTIIETWKASGVDLSEWKIIDGSGLSPNALVRPAEFTKLLTILHEDPFYIPLYSKLPKAGVNGTLKYLLRNSVYKGNLFGKSGSISNCRNYVGYFTSVTGKRIAFTVFINHYPKKDARKQIEKLFKQVWPKL